MLTVDDLRQHITTSLVDEALERLLGAAYEAIDGVLGTGGDVVELLSAGRGDLLMLSRPAYSITSIIEDDTTLAADDYRLVGDQTLLRLDDGTNPATRWRGRIEVAYAPPVDEVSRDRAAIALVQLDVDWQPGLVSQSIGQWSETYSQGADAGYAEQRQVILAALAGPPVLIL